MKIAIGCDHRGFGMKERMVKALTENGFQVEDFGIYSDEPCDYPDIAFPVAEAVSKGEYNRGILICSTGLGMSIAANKVRGAYCALCLNPSMATISRNHNNSNILSLGSGLMDGDASWEIARAWLGAEFEGGRHLRRFEKIKGYEARSD